MIFQVDHLSGEELGWVLEDNQIPGVRNRQLIPTLGRKRRPGSLSFLDIDPAAEGEAVERVAHHFPFFGYHRFATRHVFKKGTSRSVREIIRDSRKRSIKAPLHYRSFSSGRGQRLIFLESDDLLTL